MVRGPGVSGALYIGESISSSNARAGIATKNTKRHKKRVRKARHRETRERGTAGRFSLVECFMINAFLLCLFVFFVAIPLRHSGRYSCQVRTVRNRSRTTQAEPMIHQLAGSSS